MSAPLFERAVVTGAGSGLGRALCVELAARGARVLASDIDEDAARATAEACRSAAWMRCDVSKLAEVEALAEAAEEKLGGVDLIVNNAGVAVAGRVGEIPIADWHWLMGVNLWGVIHGCHVFVPRLRRQRRGHILNVASVAGLIHLPPLAAYNVSKAGVVALSETLRFELHREGIGVTVLCPTFFASNIGVSARGPATATAVAAKTIVMPMRDGRWVHRLKRLVPERFFAIGRSIIRREAHRFGLDPDDWT
jgi:NAD(P)-dependent dehydrogenase (short-subunit alcohol dehydrogenase family)